MWIDRKTYDDLWKQLHETTIANQVLERHSTTLETTMDWLRVRVTQLEMERAQLLYNYTGIKVATPVITKSEPTPHGANPMMPSSYFHDVGDAEAAKLGVSWDANGELVYADCK